MKSTMGGAMRPLDLLFRAGSMTGLSDAELIGRIRASEPHVASAAFEILVRRHGTMVLATCRGVLRNEHDAEDAFQTTFLILARRGRSLRTGQSLGPWLHRVALRASHRARVEAAQRRRREAVHQERTIAMQSHPDEVAREELRHVIHQEVNRLPERYRVVVVLCDLQSESYETAAAHLRLPVGTIRSRLSRAREQLRGRITRRGLVLPASAIAATLTAGRASAAVPEHLIASTMKLTGLAAVGAPAAGSVSTTAMACAERLLKSGGLLGLGKHGAAIAALVAGTGLIGVGSGLVLSERQPAADAVQSPTPPPLAGKQATAPPLVGEDRSRQARELLQGHWLVTEAKQQNQPLTMVVGDSLVIEGDQFAWTARRGEPERIFQRGTTRGRLAIDASVDPGQLDLIERGRTISAIYQLEADGNRLRLCLEHPANSGRPRTFTSEQRTARLLLVFRRLGSKPESDVSPPWDRVQPGMEKL